MSSARYRSAGRWTNWMIVGHVFALIFGLLGLLIAVPNPELWADSNWGATVYSWGMQYAGGLHIIFATAAMLLVGFRFLGARRTLLFFAIASVLSLGAELMGTITGFPFGEYRYTSGLGYQILGEVPFTIPLSWFYMGLASYLLAIVLVGTGPGWRRPLASVFVGSLLLTAWDLVLDPAMAHPDLGVRFWIWDQGGIYFDMPAQNFLGWVVTGFVFIGVSRLVWGSDPKLSVGLIRTSYIIYLANIFFAMVISAAVGLWWPIVIAAVLAFLPVTVALIAAEGWPGGAADSSLRDDDTVQRVSRGVMTIGGRIFLWRESSSLRVDGLEHIPAEGPVILVARHYHHLLDGCAIHVSLPRPMHAVVAIDWAESGRQSQLMQTACRMARWPMVVRPDSTGGKNQTDADRIRVLREAFRDSIQLLSEGRILTIFPEGYPTIDPHGSKKTSNDEFLPFDTGFLAIARAAQRRTGLDIPLIPVGFDYAESAKGQWDITMRVGAPVYLRTYSDEAALLADITSRVRTLSNGIEEPVHGDAARVTETS